MEKKIYYHDTDCGGVVYYANYLKFFEEARTEFLKEKGFHLRDLSQQDILFAVRHVDITYKAPARYADVITITTAVIRVKNVTLEFSQQITRDGHLLVKAVTQLVCVSRAFTPKAIPEHIRQALNL